VSIIGDALTDARVITGDQLNDLDLLFAAGKSYGVSSIKSIKDCHGELNKRVFELNESGATALGTALAIACGLASQVQRAEVVLCTDG
jgi:hypothetical protein